MILIKHSLNLYETQKDIESALLTLFKIFSENNNIFARTKVIKVSTKSVVFKIGDHIIGVMLINCDGDIVKSVDLVLNESHFKNLQPEEAFKTLINQLENLKFWEPK